MTKRDFSVRKGETLAFEYNGKPRVGTVEKVGRAKKHNGGHLYMLLRMAGDDRPQTFKYLKMADVRNG